MAKQTETLEMFDLDGTLSNLDVKAALEGQKGSSIEIQKYFTAVAEFISGQIPELTSAEVYDGIKVKSLEVVLPGRGKYEFWAKFPSVQGNIVPICPAVDHFLIARSAAEVYLKETAAKEGESNLGKKIRNFLSSASDWASMMYRHSDNAAAAYAKIDEDSIGVLESRLRRGALAVILTNSSTKKATDMLRQAGFGGKTAEGGAERGKIGVVGNAKKWQVDEDFGLVDSPFGNFISLEHFYNDSRVVLDLRRRYFSTVVGDLMMRSGAQSAWLASDIPELDLLPLMNWREFNPAVAMRTNSISAPESIEAAKCLCRAKIGGKLSEIVSDLE